MIKIENVDVYGWEAAIRGARNPMNSWDKGDTRFVDVPDTPRLDYYGNVVEIIPAHKSVIVSRKEEVWNGVGENDLKLMKNLSKAGSDHGKFLRMINVTLDITCHQVWWAEFDTYKVGSVRNSCSKMHKIHVKPFEYDDFSHEGCDEIPWAKVALEHTIAACEALRVKFNETGEKKYWRALIELLPEGYNMRATVQLNYQVLKSMYFARKNHKLTEWHEFCAWCESLPYFREVVIQE